MMEILLPPTSDITLEELETWCSAQGYLILCEGSEEEFNKATTLIDKVTELQAKFELEQAKVKILKGYTLSCGCDGAYDSGCPICTKERLEEEAIALITDKSESDE